MTDQNQSVPENLKQVVEIDQRLRKMIAEYYMALKDLNKPDEAINFLAEHITIMIEMINDFKGGRPS